MNARCTLYYNKVSCVQVFCTIIWEDFNGGPACDLYDISLQLNVRNVFSAKPVALFMLTV